MSTTPAREMYKKYPKLFTAMFNKSFVDNPEHPDDIGVIFSKLSANAHGKAEPYWTPEGTDMEPIYEEVRKYDK